MLPSFTQVPEEITITPMEEDKCEMGTHAVLQTQAIPHQTPNVQAKATQHLLPLPTCRQAMNSVKYALKAVVSGRNDMLLEVITSV